MKEDKFNPTSFIDCVQGTDIKYHTQPEKKKENRRKISRWKSTQDATTRQVR